MESAPLEVPLIELLRRIPRDYRASIEVGPCHSTNIPVGDLAARAADTLEARDAKIAALEAALKKMRTARMYLKRHLDGALSVLMGEEEGEQKEV